MPGREAHLPSVKKKEYSHTTSQVEEEEHNLHFTPVTEMFQKVGK